MHVRERHFLYKIKCSGEGPSTGSRPRWNRVVHSMLTLRVVGVHGDGSDVLGSVDKHFFEKVFTHLCRCHARSRVGFLLKDERHLESTAFTSIDGCGLVRVTFGIRNHSFRLLCGRIRFVDDIFVEKVKLLTLIVELNAQSERIQMTFPRRSQIYE